MASIFSEASRVLVWLGHEDSFMIQRAFSYICWFLNRKEDSSTARYSWGREEIPVDDSEALDQDGCPLRRPCDKPSSELVPRSGMTLCRLLRLEPTRLDAACCQP